MTAVEQEIIERVQRLDDERKQQVLNYLDQLEETSKPKFDFAEWLADIQAFQAELRAKYGDDYRIDTVQLLREVREEES